MNRNITYCIQKTCTESGNMVIFGTNIRTYFRYICYLDILCSYTSEPNSSKPKMTQLKTHT